MTEQSRGQIPKRGRQFQGLRFYGINRNQCQCKMLVKEHKEYSWSHTEFDRLPTEIPVSQDP